MHGWGSEGETGEWYLVLFTPPRNMVYPALLPLMRTPRLPVVVWTDASADLKGLIHFAERRNLVSACVPSHFKRSLIIVNLLKPTGHLMHQQFNIQQLYTLPTLYLCVLYLFENNQQLVPLTT
jgi:hypothetical protein